MNVKELLARLTDCDQYDEVIVTVDGKLPGLRSAPQRLLR